MRFYLIAILLTTVSAYIIPENNDLIKPLNTEQKNQNTQCLVKVKVDRVFSSYFKKKESSPLLQFHKTERYDS